MHFPPPSGRAILLVIVLAATTPYLVGLGDSSLWDANEAFYAETAREMLASGDYVNPSFNFRPRFNKPVLPYWMVAASYHLFGVSEGAERVPIALGGLILVATAFGLGRLVRSSDAGLLAAMVLATSPRFLMFALRIIIDVQLAMFAGLTLLFFALAEARPDRRRRYLVLMYISAALGTLTKGPIAVVLPALVFLIYLALEHRLADLRRMMLPAGALIGAAVVLPWYVLVYLQHGWDYIVSFVVGENLLRYAQTVGAQSRGVLFYPPVMIGDLLPWSIFLPCALLAGVPRWSCGAPVGAGTEVSRRTVRLLVLWVAVIVVFFSFSRTKEDLYILPIVPAEAALIGGLLAAGLERSASAGAIRALGGMALAAGGLVALVGAGLLGLLVLPGRFPLDGLAAVSTFVTIGGLLTAWLGVRSRPFAAACALAASFAAASWCFVLATLPDVERYKPVRPLAGAIQSRASDRAVVGYYRFAAPSMVFYLRRSVLELSSPEEVEAAFAFGTDVYFLMTEADYRDVSQTLPVPTYVLERRPF
ncbi:MAG: glycosyltransferase family 39 protein, partial [Candidatus Krumholzibacteria bacterium]|nr:glycosyltransferase family 39 protein [Candidatus Krumholzibacteria bacterium]